MSAIWARISWVVILLVLPRVPYKVSHLAIWLGLNKDGLTHMPNGWLLTGLSTSSLFLQQTSWGFFTWLLQSSQGKEESYMTSWDLGSEVTQLLMLHILAKASYKNSQDSRSRDSTSWWEELESHTVKWYIYRDVRLGGHYPTGEYKCWAHSPWALRDGRSHWGEKKTWASEWILRNMHVEQTQRNVQNFRQSVQTEWQDDSWYV